jgi:hypothetical protein
MREELQRDLHLKYPKIFGSESGDGIHLDVGDGWYDILDALCSQIQHHIDWKNCTGKYESHKKFRSPEELANLIPQARVEQVKEKFASLRFYYSGGDETIRGMVDMAEAITSRVCETCGRPGKRTFGGWIRTLCRRHAEEAGRSYGDAEEEAENG